MSAIGLEVFDYTPEPTGSQRQEGQEKSQFTCSREEEKSDMINERIEIWKKEEYHYPAAHGFIPVMFSYIHEDEKKHPQ